MEKIFWLDCETTGLDPQKNALIQIAALIEIDGKIKNRLNLFLKPLDIDKVDPKALELQGRTIEEIKKYPPPEKSFKILKEEMSLFVDKFDKHDKFVMAGYYVKFDIDFLRAFFEKLNDNYFGSWFFSVSYDVQFLIAQQIIKKSLRTPNYKLSTMCEKFGVKIKAHDAMSDIMATRELAAILLKLKEI